MPLPGNLTTIVVTASYVTFGGAPQSGSVTFDAGRPITNAAGQAVLDGPVTQQVQRGVMIPVTLPNTGQSALNPPDFTYTVTVAVGASTQTFSIALPSTLGETVDLSALTPVSPAPAQSAFFTANTWSGAQTFTGSPPLKILSGTAGEVLTSDAGGNITPQPPAVSAAALAAAQTAAETYADTNKLAKASNLSDLASASTARTNLGLGSAATQSSTAFDASGAASAAQSAAEAASDPAGSAASAQSAAEAASLPRTGGTMSGPIAMGGSKVTGAGNASASGDLVPFGQLGSAAFQASSAFDAAGAATAALNSAIAASLPTMTQLALTGSGALTAGAVNTVTATSGVAAMTLPTPVTGELIVCEREAASTQNVTVTGNIRGVASTTITLQLASESFMFFGYGGSWWPVAGHKTLSSLQALFPQLATANTYTADQYFKSGRPWFDVTAFGADPTGATDSTPAFNACITAITGSAAPATSTRLAKGPMFIPNGTYKITSDLIIRSTQNFVMLGAGAGQVTLKASGLGFTQAVLFIDGAIEGVFQGFQIIGDGTEGVVGSGIPDGIRLDWTTAANRSTSGNTFRDIWVRNLNFITGFSLEGTGTRQLDGTSLYGVQIQGGQIQGSWSASGNWQKGFAFGNGSAGNIYNQYLYGSAASLCYNGWYCNASSFALWGAEPFGNCIDFYMAAGGPCTVENVQSQVAGQFIVAGTGVGVQPVGFRDCEWKGYSGAGYTNLPWITTGSNYGNWIFENVSCLYPLAAPSTPPVMALGISGGTYNACYTLINVSQPNSPSAGIASFTHTQVIAINYQDTTSGGGPSAIQYPFYAVNAGVLYQQGVAASRPAAATYGEMFWYATDTSVLSHSNGQAWTTLGVSSTAPDVQFFTATGVPTANWTKPAGAKTVFAAVLGSGGGAGSGASGASGTVQCGGGGAAGAIVEHRQFVASDLPGTVAVTVGAAPNGGAAATGSNGNAGTGGNPSSFGNYVRSYGAAQGNGGTTATGTGGTSAGVTSTNLGGGAAASTTGLAGVTVQPAVLGAPGGASGGGITTGVVAGAGAAGNVSTLAADATGGTAGAVGGSGPGQGVASTLANGSCGPSPGSGAASVTGAAQAGADALANTGAGGAGGGAAINSFAFTATNASPCVFTATGSALVNGAIVQLSGGTLPAGFSAATNYYVVNASGTTFQLSATSGGSAINSTSTGSGSVVVSFASGAGGKGGSGWVLAISYFQ